MFIFGGDINIDLLKNEQTQTQNYLDTLLSFNLTSAITIPTRFTDRSVTLIDHIFIRLPKLKINNMITAGNLITDISDHLPNFVIIDFDVKKSKERPLVRVFNKKK